MKTTNPEHAGRSDIRYDILGTTAIIEFNGARSEEKKAGVKLMEFDKRIKTVLAKAGPVSGKYRTRKLRYVCGKRTYNVQYKENNCTFEFDPRKTFFSSRLSFERSRILNLTKNGENVMVMFAGVGPFAIEIAKKNKESSVVGIEINPYAYRCMIKNGKANKLFNLKAEKGDVNKFKELYKNFADRIIMPLPWSSLDFLDAAAAMARDRATIHIYVFGNKDNVVDASLNKIKEHAKKNKYRIALISSRVVRTYSATDIEIVMDYKIRKRTSLTNRPQPH